MDYQYQVYKVIKMNQKAYLCNIKTKYSENIINLRYYIFLFTVSILRSKAGCCPYAPTT